MAPIAHGRWVVVLVHSLLIAAMLFPLLVVEVPALIDYPNHLARAHILATIQENPLLQERYTADWRLVPNLGMDLVVVPLSSFVSIFTAGRLFLALTLLSVVGGTLALHRVLHGRVSLWSAVIYLFVYNHILAWGFLNNLFGLGLCLFAFAGWIATERWPAWSRLALFTLASSVLFFSHLFVFGAYGLLIGAYQLGQFLRRQEWTLARVVRILVMPTGQFVLPVLLWLMSPGATGTVPGSSGAFYYGHWASKLRALWSPAVLYGNGIDLAAIAFVCIGLLILLFTRSLTLAPAMRVPVVVLGGVSLFMPMWVFSLVGVDFRLPLFIVCLVVAGTRLEAKNRPFIPALAMVAVLLFGGRIWSTTESWRGYDQEFQELREASRTIDPGARVIVARFEELPWFVASRIYSHVVSLAVIERSVFLPDLFTGPQQPLGVTPTYVNIDMPNGDLLELKDLEEGIDPAQAEQLKDKRLRRGARPYWGNWPGNFDYLVMLDADGQDNPFPGIVRPVHLGSFFAIYAVVRERTG
jgi:hypothetical protein